MKKPFLLATLVAAPQLCRADALYTTLSSINQNGALQPMSRVTTYLKDGFERLDTAQEIGAFKATETTLSSRAKRQKITLDPNLKIYVVQGLNEVSNPVTASGTPSKAGTGTLIMTLGAKFLGLEKMMNRPVRHYTTSMQTESSGCCGVGKTGYKSEVWMADVKLPVFDASAPAFDWRQAYNSNRSDCRIDFQRRGDIQGFEAAQKGLALKTLTFDASGKMVMSSQITALSFAPLDDDQFAVPAGFKKVSRAEYDAARTQAMMAAFGGGN